MINIKLFGEQQTILRDWLETDLHCMNVIHAGAGKTFLASVALPIFATNERYHRGKDVIYSAPTREMIKSLIWEPLKRSCLEYYGLRDGQDINNSELTIRFPNGVFIRMKSAEQGDNIRGLNAGIWLADEAALYSSEVLQEILVRLRPRVGEPDTAGRFILISTPRGANAFYDLFKTAQSLPDQWCVRHLDYLKMRSGNREFIEKQKTILSPLKFAQDYLCSFENVENQFFYAFDRNKHCQPVKDRGGDLYSFHDWNKKRMCAVIAQVTDAGKPTGKIEVIKTYAVTDCSSEDIARLIRLDFNQRNIYSVIDMTGAQTNRDTTSPFGVTDRTLLEKYGFTIINSKKINPLISDTDNSSNAFIARGGLVIDPSDSLLIEAVQSYHYEDATRKNLVKYADARYMHIDGCSDALRYGIHHLFPLRHDQSAPDYVTDRASRSIPGSEYRKPSPLYPGGPSMEELLAGDNSNEDYVIY